MSGPDPPSQAGPPASKPKPQVKLSEEDQKELAALDKIFNRIKSSVPATPYILSAPSMEPYYHHSRQQATSWMIGHLFHRNEEHLQYRTFQFRQPYQDCFVLQSGEERRPTADEPKSNASTTPRLGPKKKISLAAYKSINKKTAPETPPTKEPSAQTNGTEKVTADPPPVPNPERPQSPKRPATEENAGERPPKQMKTDESLAPPPRNAEAHSSPTHLPPPNPSSDTPHGLPPLLSPVDKHLDNPHGLPAILSPTLPSNVQAELDRLQLQRKRADSSASVSTSSSDLKSQPAPKPTAPEQKREQKPEQITASSRAPSSSINGHSPSSTSNSRVPPPKLKLVVKLKYSKRIADKVKQILKPPTSKKAPLPSEKARSHQGNGYSKKSLPQATEPTISKNKMEGAMAKAKDSSNPAPGLATTPTEVNKGAATITKMAEKRPRSSEEEHSETPSKRLKPSNEGMTTPVRPTTSSPAKSTKSSAQKSQIYTTPLKDHKAVSMLRTSSAESHDSTPGRSGSTPANSKHIDAKAAPTSAPLSGKKQADYQLLSQTSQRLNNMGRTLKHQAQKILTEKGKQLSKADQKRAAATGLECILSYMAAYGAQDQSNSIRSRPSDVEGTWKTLLPLCMSYATHTKEFPHLEGLRLHLYAVICAAICAHVSSRIARLKAQDLPQDPSQPGFTKQVALLADNAALLSDNYQRLLKATQDARVSLPFEAIQKSYPETWNGREPDARLSKAPEMITTGSLAGPYFLPIQNDTTPFQAVRFGLKFLSEYCAKEKLNHSLRVNLEKPE